MFLRDGISWKRGKLSVDSGWRVAWGLSRTQVLGTVLPLAETCERRSSPVCRSRAGETLPGMPRKKGQWPEVCQRKVR